MELTEDEIISILKIIEESNFDELHLETGNFKLTISKVGPASATPQKIFDPADAQSPNPRTTVTAVRQQPAEAKVEKPKPEAMAGLEEGLVPIKSPSLGTFYRRPEPGAPPYVEVGTFVKEDDTVCLIEVMKVFTAVKAGLRGCIDEVCAESGQFVEYGQNLFLVRPEGTPEKGKA
jgi:acetyl-CoA carboxylase biotin carboxyl carrier protein